MNVSGGIGDRWLYTASIYQNFDPGSFAPKFENFSDRTQLYHAGLTRLFNNNRGKFSVIYKFSKSNALGSMINAAPFIKRNFGVQVGDFFICSRRWTLSIYGRNGWKDEERALR